VAPRGLTDRTRVLDCPERSFPPSLGTPIFFPLRPFSGVSNSPAGRPRYEEETGQTDIGVPVRQLFASFKYVFPSALSLDLFFPSLPLSLRAVSAYGNAFDLGKLLVLLLFHTGR